MATSNMLRRVAIISGAVFGVGLLSVFFLGLMAFLFLRNDANGEKYSTEIDAKKIPYFTSVPLGFSHRYDREKSLPIATASLIDVDGDLVDEIFFGGGLEQEDACYAFRDNQFVDISAEVNLPKKGSAETTLSSISADFNGDGWVDLMVGRESGLVLYENHSGQFVEKKIDTPMNGKSTPAGITVGDIDHDGDLDIFLATYIKKDLMEGQTIFEDPNYGSTSELLLNVGDEQYQSITVSAGLDYVHNTFQGVFVDIDNDSWLDLVVAHDTGEVRTYRNNGDLTFELKENPLTGRFAYPMGIAVGDYDNNGWVDFMFSNTGSTLPRFLAKGDVTDASKFNEKLIVFKNEGNFSFVDSAEVTQVADYEFSWGTVFADLNNDGLQDLMIAENYVDLIFNQWCRLPSRVLIQREDHTFVSTEKRSGLRNPHYAISPLVSDFNQDGYLDMVWVNIDTPSLAYLNNGGNNHYLQVDIGEGPRSQGAKVKVKTLTQTYTQDLVTGEGLAGDQTALLHFGLGEEDVILEVVVIYSDGHTQVLSDIQVDSILQVDVH